ncbi:hypothetical protein ACLB1M_02920 [Escherichia coli]
MTIAERIYNDGWLLGMEKGKEEGEQRLFSLFCRMGQILNGYKRLPDFQQEQMQALRRPLPEIKRNPWIKY